jgi:hypothetical protein
VIYFQVIIRASLEPKIHERILLDSKDVFGMAPVALAPRNQCSDIVARSHFRF